MLSKSFISISKVVGGLALLMAATAVVDVFGNHRAFALVDEEAAMAAIQRLSDGQLPSFRYAGASLWYAWMGTWTLLFGTSLNVVRAAVLAGLALESVLLWHLAKRWFSPRAAWWAVAVNVVSAFTLLRAHSLLAFSLAPLWFLAILLAAEKFRGRAGSAAVGMAAALALSDYEAWLFGLPVIAVSLLRPRQDSGKVHHAAAGLGFAVGVVMIAYASQPWLGDHIAIRGRLSAPSGIGEAFGTLLRHIWEFFAGGARPLAYLGVDSHPVWPPWALPALAAGLIYCWKRRRHLPIVAAIALVPLAARSPGLEPNRAVMAWPLLCLLAGAGFDAVQPLLQRRLPRLAWLPLVLLLSGPVMEIQAYLQSMQRGYPTLYARGENMIQAAAFLNEQEKDAAILCDLDSKSSEHFRLLLKPHPAPGQATRVWALIPWSMVRSAQNTPPGWKSFRAFEDQPPIFLAPVAEQELQTWIRREQAIRGYHRCAAQNLDPSPCLKSLAANSKAEDSWMATVYWEARISRRRLLGKIEVEEINRALNAPLLSSRLFLEEALLRLEREPQTAEKLFRQAVRMDPRRRRAWEGWIDSLEATGKQAQAQEVKKEYLSRPQESMWGKSWVN